MSSSLIRWGAAAAILGGVLGILLTPFATFAGWLSASDQTTLPTYPDMLWAQLAEPLVTPFLGFGTYEAVYATYGKVFFLVYLLFLIGLVCLRARVSEHIGRLGKPRSLLQGRWHPASGYPRKLAPLVGTKKGRGQLEAPA